MVRIVVLKQVIILSIGYSIASSLPSNTIQMLYFILQYHIKVTILWSWQHTRLLVLRHLQQPMWRHRMFIQENLSDRQRHHYQYCQQARVSQITVSCFVLSSRDSKLDSKIIFGITNRRFERKTTIPFLVLPIWDSK